jgi:hypothetical protein
MNIQMALEILHVENISTITLTELKKKYHKLALQFHPDKNGNSEESKKHFQNIGAAYDLLKKEIANNGEDGCEDNDSKQEFDHLLHTFLSKIFTNTNLNIILAILTDIVSVKLFEKVDKESLIQIYDFIVKYKTILHISDAILEQVRLIILEKYKDVQIFILNPTIVDLFENNFYRLNINSIPYYVPLWHHEVVYNNLSESGDGEIIVKCIPDLPDNLEIDENNNIILYKDISFTFSLFLQESIPIYINKYCFHIPVQNLYLKTHQTFILKGQGISKIETDVMNVSEKADIIFKIRFLNK